MLVSVGQRLVASHKWAYDVGRLIGKGGGGQPKSCTIIHFYIIFCDLCVFIHHVMSCSN